MELINIYQTLKRWLWLIISIVVLTIVVLGLRLVFAKPIFAGTVKIQISTPQNEDITAFDEYRSVSQRELVAIARNNFSDLLLGDEVHNRTVEQLGLQSPDNDFDPEIRTRTDSDFINLYLEASTPELAMNIANTLADEAIVYYGELRAKPTEAEKELYLEQAWVAEEEYRAAEGAFTAFLIENNISSLESDITLVEKLIEQLKLERDQRIITGSLVNPLTQIDQLIVERQAEVDRLLALKPMYTILEERADNARVQYQNALELYTSGSVLDNAEANNREAQDAFIAFKTENQVNSLQDDIDIVTRSLEQLQLERDRLSLDEPSYQQIESLIIQRQEELDRLIELQPEYTDLENKVQDAADNYQHVLDKVYEAELKSTVIREANFIQVIEPAGLPEEPENNSIQVLVLGIIGSVGFAVILAFVLDYFFAEDQPFNIDRVGTQSVFDLRVLGSTPESKEIHFEQGSLGAEAMRQIRTRAFLYSPNESLKTILVSSSLAGDGKTTTAANLSVAFASGNKKVLVIDADLRLPNLNEWFGVENLKGFSDLLETDPEELSEMTSKIVRETENEGVWLLTAGQNRQDPSLLLSSNNFPRILEHLSREFDHIIIDSPPILSSPDAVIMAKIVDAAIVVVSPGRTIMSALEEALDTFKSQKDINIIGLAFNRINPHAYGYGYYSEPDASPGFLTTVKSFFTNIIPSKNKKSMSDSGEHAKGTAARQPANKNQVNGSGELNTRTHSTDVDREASSDRRISSEDMDEKIEKVRNSIPKSTFETPLGVLPITPNKIIALTRADYSTIGELMLQMEVDSDELASIDGFGPKTIQSIREALDEYFDQNHLSKDGNGSAKESNGSKEKTTAGMNGDEPNFIRDSLYQMSRLAFDNPLNISKYFGSKVSARIIARKRWKEQSKTFYENDIR